MKNIRVRNLTVFKKIGSKVFKNALKERNKLYYKECAAYRFVGCRETQRTTEGGLHDLS